MGHWVGHNKYIEILRILLYLIFIYLIIQINKDTLSDLQQNSLSYAYYSLSYPYYSLAFASDSDSLVFVYTTQ